MDEKITFSKGKKFDIQLSRGLVAERRLGDIFVGARLDKIEVKCESWQWEQHGNIALEFCWDGEPSGLASTEADIWVHELKRDGHTLVWLMFPIERIKELARICYREGRVSWKAGDGGKSAIVKVPLRYILR